MRQLDLFAAIADAEPAVPEQRAQQKPSVIETEYFSEQRKTDVAIDSILNEGSTHVTNREQLNNEQETGLPLLNSDVENKHLVFHQLVEEPAVLAEAPAEEFILLDENETTLPATKNPSLNDNPVLFSDGNISVKVKAKPVAGKPRVVKEKVKRPPQKRGRKSFKEIDAELDLIEIPDDEILFQKHYYSISTVAGWFRVNTSLIRFWENEFDILKPKKNRKGDRLFRPEDVKNLHLIYQLLRQRKFTMEGAKEYLKANKKKADVQLQLTSTLQKFKSFLLELKANLQS